MKKIFFIFIASIILQGTSYAVNLSDALLEAFLNNPELNAERENLNASKEDLNISKSDFLPSVTSTGSKSSEDTTRLTNRDGSVATPTDVNPEVKSIKVEQTIFQGLGGLADLKKSEIGLVIADAKLLQTEQNILYKAADAFSGLIFANKKYLINQGNLNLSERQVETDRIRLDRGQISLADLAQSESSLAEAQAKFIQAKNDVVTAKLNYENVIGSIQDTFDLNEEVNLNLNIPQSLDVAIATSKVYSPDLIIAELEYEQSKKDVDIARSDLSPSATLSFETKETEDLSSSYDEQEKETLKATITWPLFSGGENYASLNKSKNLMNRKRLLLDNAVKLNDTNVASSWSQMESNKSLLESVRLQVKAAEIANEGITAEYETGKGRSTLDVIQSNTILLNSQISLANSERQYLLSQFKLLQSIGMLSAKNLKLAQ